MLSSEVLRRTDYALSGSDPTCPRGEQAIHRVLRSVPVIAVGAAPGFEGGGESLKDTLLEFGSPGRLEADPSTGGE